MVTKVAVEMVTEFKIQSRHQITMSEIGVDHSRVLFSLLDGKHLCSLQAQDGVLNKAIFGEGHFCIATIKVPGPAHTKKKEKREFVIGSLGDHGHWSKIGGHDIELLAELVKCMRSSKAKRSRFLKYRQKKNEIVKLISADINFPCSIFLKAAKWLRSECWSSSKYGTKPRRQFNGSNRSPQATRN